MPNFSIWLRQGTIPVVVNGVASAATLSCAARDIHLYFKQHYSYVIHSVLPACPQPLVRSLDHIPKKERNRDWPIIRPIVTDVYGRVATELIDVWQEAETRLQAIVKPWPISGWSKPTPHQTLSLRQFWCCVHSHSRNWSATNLVYAAHYVLHLLKYKFVRYLLLPKFIGVIHKWCHVILRKNYPLPYRHISSQCSRLL